MANSTQTHEKRRAPRIPISDPKRNLFSAYLLTKNIPEKISGELLDYSENGLGVRITAASNLPKVGDHLHGLLYQQNSLKETSKELGKIRYIESLTDESGKKQIRAGIEITSVGESISQIKASELPSRPHRYAVNQDCIEETEVLLSFEDEKIKGTLLNFSKFGIAIQITRECPLRLEIAKEIDAIIKIKGQNLFEGNLIIRHVKELAEKIIIGCEVKDQILDIEVFQKRIDVILLSESLQTRLKAANRYQNIRSEFKSAVSDFRQYMEYVQEVTDKNVPVEVLKEIYPLFSGMMDAIYDRLIDCFTQISSQEVEIYKEFLQKQTLSLFTSGPFQKHAYQKPYGYAGDYEMVLKILDKEVEGERALSRLLNIYGWNMGIVKAHRNRVEILFKKIEEIVRNNSEAKILTIGSGPSREIQLFIERYEEDLPCSFTLVDFDDRALDHSRNELLKSSILKKKRKTHFNFINKSIRQIIKTGYCDSEKDEYDFIYCAGLFDYLSDPFCKKLLQLMYGQLKEPGYLLATNVSKNNYYRYYMEMILEWYLTCRDSSDMLILASDLEKEGENLINVNSDDTGLNLFLNVRKIRANQSQLR